MSSTTNERRPAGNGTAIQNAPARQHNRAGDLGGVDLDARAGRQRLLARGTNDGAVGADQDGLGGNRGHAIDSGLVSQRSLTIRPLYGTEPPSRKKTQSRSPMPLHIHDTLRREKRLFEPRDPNRVTLYVCGPTVYDRAHLGNARPVVVIDVLVRRIDVKAKVAGEPDRLRIDWRYWPK